MSRIQYFKSAFLVTLCLIVFNTGQTQNITSQIDTYVSSIYNSDDPGVAILVAKDGKPIYQNAFGLANLELKIPLTTKNVFEVGSITKQFTAVSILMLEEQGKLKVEDEIIKYIPDYPTHGKKITIRNLLNHTSGIKSYTSMANFMELARKDMTPKKLIDVFKDEPMDFDPGEKFLYSNSGYILLGYIIEVVTGDTYKNFIEKNIFSKLGMLSSYYGSKKEIIMNRASGYQKSQEKYVNANYLSMTLPYAAGSIMSTINDLLIWQNAINANTLITRASLNKAINGSTLNNGKNIPYGFGWFKGSIRGASIFGHSGGIFGYTTNEIYFPQENVYVVGFSNCDCKDVSGTTKKVAAMVIGNPYPDVKDTITISKENLKKWVGTYQFDKGVIRYITLKDSQLYSLREGEGSRKYKIYPIKEDYFIFEDGTISYQFSLQRNGKKQTLFKTDNESILGKQIEKAPPTEKMEIQLSSTILKQYVGKYELQPNFIIEITVNGDKIFAQATGQRKFQIFAEKENQFFFKVVAASITFIKNNKDNVESLILNQGGRKMSAKKL